MSPIQNFEQHSRRLVEPDLRNTTHSLLFLFISSLGCLFVAQN